MTRMTRMKEIILGIVLIRAIRVIRGKKISLRPRKFSFLPPTNYPKGGYI
jgi:hypothetical protein